jgi:molybdate transport system substrate-binding protein
MMPSRPRARLEWLATAIAFFATIATAAEIHVLSAAAVKGPLVDTASAFERDTGNRVVLEFTTAGQVESKMAAGARPDVAVNTRIRLDALAAKGPVTGMSTDLGTVRIGVAARAGAPRPDISSVDAFRAALLVAQTISYTNPAAGGTAGSYFAGVIDKLGIADAIAGKRRLAADGLDVMRKVTAGEADLGITQASEILLMDKAAYVGPLPEALQLLTTYAAWVPESADPAARAFAAALTSEHGKARFRAAGFE